MERAGRPITSAAMPALKDIAKRQGISKKYLEQIVPVLNRAGILLTNRGFQGGYRLARSPESITAGEVLRLTEGSLAPADCVATAVNTCPRKEECATLEVWQGLAKVINDYLDKITLQQILDDQRKLDEFDYVI